MTERGGAGGGRGTGGGGGRPGGAAPAPAMPQPQPAPGSPASRAVPVVAGAGDAFEDVLARVRAAGRGGAAVDLVVARESGLLLTAGEFRALREAIDRERLAVTLRCDDALRDGLARAMGVERRRIPPELRALLAGSPAAAPPAVPAPAPRAVPHATPRAADVRPAPPQGRPVRPGSAAAAGAAADPHLAYRRPTPAAGGPEPAPPGGGLRAAPAAFAHAGEASGPDAAGSRAGSRPSSGGPTSPASAAPAAVSGAAAPRVRGPGAGPNAGASGAAVAGAGSDPAYRAGRGAATADAALGGAGIGAGAGGESAAGSVRADGGGAAVASGGPRDAATAEPTAGPAPAVGGWPEQPGPPPPPPAPPPAPARGRTGGRFRRRDRRADPTAPAPTAAAVAPPPGNRADAAPAEALPANPSSAVGGGPRRIGPEPALDEPAGPTFDRIVAPRYRGSRRPRWLAPALAGLALAILAGLAVALLTPRATVAVALRTAPVAGEALVDVTASGEPLAGDDGAALAVAASPVEVAVAFSGTVPTTGARAEPDATASGTVRFANPNPEPVTVPAGTELTTGDGTVFVTTEDVSTPGADPATGQAGQGEGAIRAAAPGTAGNVVVGEIGGRLPSGVYYSNREEATAGGTDRQVPIVAAADLEALRAEAEAALAEQAAAAAQEQLGAGAQLLPGSATVLAGDETFSAAEGEAVAEVSLEATRTVRALAWSPAAAEDDLRGLLAGPPAPFLAGQAPEGWVVDPASIGFGAAVVDGGSPEGARVRIPVEALATPRFGPDERRALAERLAGLDEAAATALLGEEPALTGAAIEFRPSWFWRRLPSDPDRIEVTTATTSEGESTP